MLNLFVIASLQALSSPEPVKEEATAEDLIRATKGITSATGKAVSAGNSAKQNEAIAAANEGRKTVVGLLMTCKAAAVHAETPQARSDALEAGRKCGQAYHDVLGHVLSVCVLIIIDVPVCTNVASHEWLVMLSLGVNATASAFGQFIKNFLQK